MDDFGRIDGVPYDVGDYVFGGRDETEEEEGDGSSSETETETESLNGFVVSDSQVEEEDGSSSSEGEVDEEKAFRQQQEAVSKVSLRKPKKLYRGGRPVTEVATSLLVGSSDEDEEFDRTVSLVREMLAECEEMLAKCGDMVATLRELMSVESMTGTAERERNAKRKRMGDVKEREGKGEEENVYSFRVEECEEGMMVSRPQGSKLSVIPKRARYVVG